MSFQDLLSDMEAGLLPLPSPSQEAARGVFQINTKVEALRWMADALGTPKDTPSLRGRLRGTRAGITRLARSTYQALRQAANAARAGGVSSSAASESRTYCSKLAMDFEAAMNEYKKVERRIAAAERQETAAAARRSPFSPPPPSSSSLPPPTFNRSSTSSDRNHGDQRFPNHKETQLVVLENEIEYNEALIAEREEGIRQVQQEITDVHEIFRDLAMLVHDQGECIDVVTSNIDRTGAATSQAEEQLSKAAGIREEQEDQLLPKAAGIREEKEEQLLPKDAGRTRAAEEEPLSSDARTKEECCSTKCLLLTVLGLSLLIFGLVFA
ncbi:hypothetical protein ABZP36_021602 [Zizania latifolia]